MFGGDSWAREANQRKRRADDLLIDGVDSSSFKRLSNGKFTCLVCSNRPLLDSSLMLSMHSKGARHRAELSRLKEKELIRRNEINKRIALSDNPVSKGSPSSSTTRSICPSKPLIEQTRKAASELSSTKYVPKSSEIDKADAYTRRNLYSAQGVHHLKHSSLPDPRARGEIVASKEQLDFRERRERELKFTAAGWKRDGYGKWYRDENVEFDSDEEDPNIVLA